MKRLQVEKLEKAASEYWSFFVSVYFPGMKCEVLNRQQLEALISSVRRTTGYLFKLERRMDELHFPEGDRLRLAALEAFKASQDMFEVRHDLACDGEYGQGRKAK